jgi:hypothetical protein
MQFCFQPGFAFLEAGSVRSKNVTSVLMKNYSELCFGEFSELCSKQLKTCTAPLKDYSMNFRFCIGDLFHMLSIFVREKRRKGNIEMEDALSFLRSSYVDPFSAITAPLLPLFHSFFIL